MKTLSKETWQRIGAYSFISMLGIAGFLSYPYTISHPIAPASAQVEKVKKDYFADISLEAKAAYVVDMATGEVLYAKNEQDVVPLASLTKLMTAITASDLAPESAVVTVAPEALREQGDSGLFSNEKWKLTDLLKFTLLVSSNDGAAAVAAALGSHTANTTADTSRAAFVSAMNVKAQSLGLSTLRFLNESGLDVNEIEAGAYGSAKDVAKLLSYTIKQHGDIVSPTRYTATAFESLDNIKHHARNTSEIAGTIPGLIAGKTGYSVLAGGNLAVAFDAGIQHPVIVVVLGSSYSGRFSDVEKLVDASIESIAGEHILE